MRTVFSGRGFSMGGPRQPIWLVVRPLGIVTSGRNR